MALLYTQETPARSEIAFCYGGQAVSLALVSVGHIDTVYSIAHYNFFVHHMTRLVPSGFCHITNICLFGNERPRFCDNQHCLFRSERPHSCGARREHLGGGRVAVGAWRVLGAV